MGVTSVLRDLISGPDDPARWDDDPAYQAAVQRLADADAPSPEVRAAEAALEVARRRRGEVDARARIADPKRPGDPLAGLEEIQQVGRVVVQAEKDLRVAQSGKLVLDEAERAVTAARQRLTEINVAVRVGDASPPAAQAAAAALDVAECNLRAVKAAQSETATVRAVLQGRVNAAETAARQRVFRKLAAAHQRDVEQLAARFRDVAEICDRLHARWQSIDRHFPTGWYLKDRREINQYRPPDQSLPNLAPLAWDDFVSRPPDASTGSRYQEWLQTARKAGYNV